MVELKEMEVGDSYKETDAERTFCRNPEGVVRKQNLEGEPPNEHFCEVIQKKVMVINGLCQRDNCEYSL